jgi:hypothetical protein
MVDALRRTHRWLQPTGYLVDIRPTSEAAYLEAQLAAGTVVAGRVSDVNDQVGPNARHARADTALAIALERRWFIPEVQLEFSFHRYAGSVDEVRDHVRGEWMGAAIADEALQRAARLHASEPNARLRVREQVGIVRLRPFAADGTRGLGLGTGGWGLAVNYTPLHLAPCTLHLAPLARRSAAPFGTREGGSAGTSSRPPAPRRVRVHLAPSACTSSRPLAPRPVRLHLAPSACTSPRPPAPRPVRLHLAPSACTSSRLFTFAPGTAPRRIPESAPTRRGGATAPARRDRSPRDRP